MTAYPRIPADAACRDVPPEVFFPDPGDDVGAAKAKAICTGCPAFEPCLDWAVVHGELGIWAATSEGDRARIRRDRGIVAQRIPTRIEVDRWRVIAIMTAAGHTAAEIGAAVGLTPAAVSNARQRMREAS